MTAIETRGIATLRRLTLAIGLSALAGCGASDKSDLACLENQNFPVAAYDAVEVACPSLDYQLTVPETCENGGCGVILDIHGGTMDARVEDAGTNLSALGKDAIAFGASTPYIVIQPSEPSGIWSEAGADDQNVFDFMQSVVNVFNADTNRIHMGGFSQGSSMTWRFICNYTDTFASFAPIAGVNPNDQGNIGCDLPRKPILFVNGLLDPFAIYAFEATPVLATVRETIGAANLEELTLGEGDKHTHISLTGNGYLFEHISHDSIGLVGGHCIPGGTSVLGCSGSFAYGEEALKFYIEHPKP